MVDKVVIRMHAKKAPNYRIHTHEQTTKLRVEDSFGKEISYWYLLLHGMADDETNKAHVLAIAGLM